MMARDDLLIVAIIAAAGGLMGSILKVGKNGAEEKGGAHKV